MYRTCLFCSSALGSNEAVEHFPVGRRLAFDAAKGRLWVVCRKCERWNLTPLEERWEAIEECERAFRATRLRVSTDQVGLARLKEGLELVRIGDPQRPEMAAWRYGDQFGRRRRRQYLIGGATVLVAGTVVVAGPLLGILGAGAISPVWNIGNSLVQVYRAKKLISVPAPEGVLRTRLADVERIRLTVQHDTLQLSVPVVTEGGAAPRWRFNKTRETRILEGEAAVRAAGALLPLVNRSGGSAADVQRAVGIVEEAESPERLFATAARTLAARSGSGFGDTRRRTSLKRVPLTTRLALEMAAHEETERRALEGELYLLEEAWKQAEEIAAIADDMFLPQSIDADLVRLREARGPDSSASS